MVDISQRLVLAAVIPDRLNRAPFKGFHARLDVIIVFRLGMNVGISAVLIPGKEIRCRFAAKVTIDALFIDIEFTHYIFRPLFVFICHSA